VLEQVCADYPLSLHGIGLSLGSAEPVRSDHLRQLKMLADAFEPRWVSDHLAWVGIGNRYLNDLLPLPYTEEALGIIGANIRAAQDYLGRQLLLENPSLYLAFSHSTIDEAEFLAELVAATGCGLLIDINNIYVSAANLQFDPLLYLQQIPATAVAEIHLAGFTREDDLLIDTHSRPVDAEVWRLYSRVLELFGDIPTLIEWDTDLPALSVLLDEAATANQLRGLTDEALHRAVAS
jgi:uncharacterized protein (UPF0276 family)